MKTTLSIRNFIMAASVLILMLSCKKEDMPVVQGIQPVNSGQKIIGAITDLGPVTTDLRLMQVEISNPGSLFEDISGDYLASVDKIVINFFTQEDGIIPPGTYNFSSGDRKEPFTFNSGILTVPAGVVKAAGGSGNQISEGFVDVSRNGSDYVFTFSCLLNSGELLSGTSIGSTTYQDSF